MATQSPNLPASPRVLVELRGVSKSFAPPSLAVRDLSISLGRDAYVVVVGPSGCGKTTLLRLIAGLEEPTAGSVLINGADAADIAPHARGVALAAQGAPLYPHLTVRENLGFAARARSVLESTVRDRVSAVADALVVTDLLNRLPGELSGGQRQRVALGRALVQEASITLLDEPLAALEPELRGRVRVLLRERQRATASLFIHVTHDHEEAISLASELVVMHGGTIRQHAPTSEILEAPSDRFVAEFLSDPPLNIFEGRVEVVESENAARFVSGALSIPLSPIEASFAVRLAQLGSIAMTLFPEAMDVQPAGVDGTWQSGTDQADVYGMSGTVMDITHRAGRLVLHVRLGGLTLRAIVPVADRARFSIGSRVRIVPDASKAHFFEPGPTGRRISGRAAE
jgi:ABC-type sugar transport system ATPase subunit